MFVSFFRWFDEISIVFEDEKNLTEKVYHVREWLRGIHIFVAVYCC